MTIYKAVGVNVEKYKAVGVDIKKSDEFVKKIRHITKNRSIGLFGSVFDVKSFNDPLFVTSTDGVGTKLKLAFRLNKHDTIGIDLVAMSVNDVICHGAKPLQFLDYFSTSSLDISVATEVIKGINNGCSMAGCTLGGGETSEMPGMYKEGEYDLAGFCIGAVERKLYLPKALKKSDLLVAIPSSGVHSNGFSLVNHILNKEASRELLEQLLTPTRIYVIEVLSVLKLIKAAAHITGGGLYSNIIRVTLKHDIHIDYSKIKTPKIFEWIKQNGNITDGEMYKVFNMGIGMVLIVGQKNVEQVISMIDGSYIFGKVV